MPYRRGSFLLTPPSLPLFVVSLVLAIAAVLVRYAGVSLPIINSGNIFDILAIAYVILLVGVLLPGA
jgi:hypothetical protein